MAIRVGLIGAGRVGRKYLETAAGLPDVQVAGVCDSDRELAQEAARPFGAGVHIHFRTLIEAERLDALLVCVPPFARGEPESAAARSGIHLFLDRPVALSVEKARQIQAEIEKAEVVAAVASPWRYLSGVERAKELLQGKRIALIRGWRLGTVPREGWRRKREASGGLFAQEAIDLLDTARYIGGEMATIAAVRFEGIVAARVPNYDLEDAACALIRFQSGAVGEIHVADVCPREETLLSILTDNLELRITEEFLEVIEMGRLERTAHAASGLEVCLKAFFDAVRTGKTDLVRTHYADAIRTLEVALAANQAAQTGKAVNL